MTLRDVDQIVSAAEDGRHHHVKIEGVVPNQIVLDGNLVHIVQNTDITGADVQWPGEALGAGVEVGTPTASNPATTPWPGMANFTVHFLKVSNNSKKESWDYSADLNKLFIDMGKSVKVCFTAGTDPPEGLFIRALPIYADPSFLTEPVKRCPNHASLSDSSNTDFPAEFSEHLIRVTSETTVYEEDPASKRLSVVVPFERPQGGTDYCAHLFKFMCLGSDVGGINRKPVKVIFTLEQGPGEVVGRHVFDVRICSCPKRDKVQEETKFHKDRAEAMGLAEGLARSNSVFTKPSAKKRKMEVEEFVMVPVAKNDFEKLNEFAEAAVIMRNPDKSKEIKDQRRKLMEMHNKRYLNKPRQ